MDKAKQNSFEQLDLLISTYTRLKNLIYDDIPKIVWEKKYDFVEKKVSDDEVQRIVRFEPE